MNIAIINSLGKNNFFKCYKSLKSTMDIRKHKIQKFSEKKTRGHTLNYIIKKLGTKDDILILADDVELTAGWYQKLKKNENKAEMWGASMLYPKSKKIQDNGYELVKINEKTFLNPLRRGKKFKKNPKQEWKYADCVCGCFLYLRKKVFRFQKKFYPSYGMNRWDELTFMLRAKSKGLKLAVLNHYLYHEGTSTKSNPNKNLSSISYQIEKKLWKRLENKFVNKKKINKEIKINFNKNIFRILNNKKNKILFYGAGIFSENLLSSRLIQSKRISITSTLEEESGNKLNDKYKILNFNKLQKKKYNTVIITPSDAANNIYKNFFNGWLKNNWKGKFYKVKERKTSNYWNYNLNEIKK